MADETITTRGRARRAASPRARLWRLATPVACALTAAVLLSACGGKDRSPSSATGRQWPPSTVVRLAGLRRTPDLSYHIAAHPECATLVLLRSTAEVDTYKNSGDVIVTNPDRSAGADVTMASPPCRRLFAQALSRVR